MKITINNFEEMKRGLRIESPNLIQLEISINEKRNQILIAIVSFQAL